MAKGVSSDSGVCAGRTSLGLVQGQCGIHELERGGARSETQGTYANSFGPKGGKPKVDS